MVKSQIRKKIIKLRKFKNKKNIKLNFSKLLRILKILNYKKKLFGGYYPINFEMDDIHILRELEKKGANISLPKIKSNTAINHPPSKTRFMKVTPFQRECIKTQGNKRPEPSLTRARPSPKTINGGNSPTLR